VRRCVARRRVETGFWPSCTGDGVLGRLAGRWTCLRAYQEVGASAVVTGAAVGEVRSCFSNNIVCAGHSHIGGLRLPLTALAETPSDLRICSNFRGLSAHKPGFRTFVWKCRLIGNHLSIKSD